MTQEQAKKKDRAPARALCLSVLMSPPGFGQTAAQVAAEVERKYNRKLTPNAVATRLKEGFSEGKCYPKTIDGNIHYWATPKGKEADCIIYYENQQIAQDYARWCQISNTIIHYLDDAGERNMLATLMGRFKKRAS